MNWSSRAWQSKHFAQAVPKHALKTFFFFACPPHNIPFGVSSYLKGLAENWHMWRPSTARQTTKFDKHEKPLIYLRKLLGSITMDFNIAATQNTAGVWVPCYAAWPQTNLRNANFVWIVSFNRLQKWVWGSESEGLAHSALSGHRGCFGGWEPVRGEE